MIDVFRFLLRLVPRRLRRVRWEPCVPPPCPEIEEREISATYRCRTFSPLYDLQSANTPPGGARPWEDNRPIATAEFPLGKPRAT